MLLSKLVNGFNFNITDDTEIQGIQVDTRKLSSGDLFVAIPGHNCDGHQFIPTALEKGAAALLISTGKGKFLPDSVEVPVLKAESPREFLITFLQRFYGNPSEKLQLLGITGTNGKTTTTHLLESIFAAEGESVGLIGTITRRFKGEQFKGECTTPSVVDNYRTLQEWASEGASAVIMEVSSHGLDQDRVGGLSFAAAGFTNLSQDHLDYHGDMENYYRAKKRLFEQSQKNVVYLADEYCRRLAEEVKSVTVGEAGDYRVVKKSSALTGIELTLQFPDGKKYTFNSPLTGLHNFKNIALAVAITAVLGIKPAVIKKGLKNCDRVPGRCERISSSPAVIVDYAHTPDAVRNVISGLKPLYEGDLICVFGAGGDRDSDKRPAMGEAAIKLAGYSIVTSDNPRSESPRKIVEDILIGMEGDNYHVQLDRGQAIREAIERAGADDLVLILGKGHETEQIIGDRVLPFNDAQVAREVLETVE